MKALVICILAMISTWILAWVFDQRLTEFESFVIYALALIFFTAIHILEEVKK